MFVGNFELSERNGWYVEDITIRTKKEIRSKDLPIKHGVDYDDYAYFNGLEIIITGKCKSDPIVKSRLLDIINYGVFYLTFDDGFYVVENSSVNFRQSAETPNLETFQLVFISPVPYKYNNNDIVETSTTISNTTKIILENDNVKMSIEDINLKFDVTTSSTIFCTRNYKILSCEKDNGSLEPVNENYLTEFDKQGNSLNAVFSEKRYISRFYLYFDTITNYQLFKSDIEIFYKDKTGVFTEINNDISFKTVDATGFGLAGKLYIFENINVETEILKVLYTNPLGKSYYKYYSDFTRRNLALIVPDYNTFCEFRQTGEYFMNPQKGILLHNGRKDVSSFIGQLIRIFPKTTYAYSTNNISLQLKFNNYNFYEVEHV